jgi:hypothetical protein
MGAEDGVGAEDFYRADWLLALPVGRHVLSFSSQFIPGFGEGLNSHLLTWLCNLESDFQYLILSTFSLGNSNHAAAIHKPKRTTQ